MLLTRFIINVAYYYLKNRDVPLDYDKLLEFTLQIKDSKLRLTYEKIQKIRKMIGKMK